MSKKHPECPLAIPRNCPEFRNARVCALIRGDKKCLRKFGGSRPRVHINHIGPGHTPNQPRPIRNIQTTIKKGTVSAFFYRHRS